LILALKALILADDIYLSSERDGVRAERGWDLAIPPPHNYSSFTTYSSPSFLCLHPSLLLSTFLHLSQAAAAYIIISPNRTLFTSYFSINL